MKRLAIALLSSCSNAPPVGACAESFDALIVASDYTSSMVGGVSMDGRTSLGSGVDLGGDPALALSAGRAFLLARDSGSIFELDPRCGKPLGELSSRDPGATRSPNPHDLAVAPDGTLYVTRYDAPSLYALPQHGEPYAIDLGPLDIDGNPQPEAVWIDGDRAFVSLERLDEPSFLSTRTSQMAVIDLKTRSIAQVVDLRARNPFGRMVADGGFLYLAAPGNFDVGAEADAGLERFDPKALTSEIVISENLLSGGSLAEVVVSGSCAVGITADPTPNVNRTSLVVIDLDKKQTTPLFGTPGFDLRGLHMTDRALFVGDRRKTSGGYAVHIFPRSGCKFDQTARQMTLVGLPPVALGRP